jgi:aminodeoxyfutalosine synthase
VVTYGRVFEVQAGAGWPEGAGVPEQAGEVRIVGAVQDLDAAVGVTKAAAAAAQGRPVTGFELDALDRACRAAGRPLDELLRRLRDAGLELVSEAAIDVIHGMDLFELPFSLDLPVARLTIHHATSEDGVFMIQQAVEVQRRWPVGAFAPLTRSTIEPPSTGYDDMRQVALARLLGRDLDRIQVDWGLHGPKLAQSALLFGADDLDGVPAADDVQLGRRRSSVEEVRRNVEAASLSPVERNGRFDEVRA